MRSLITDVLTTYSNEKCVVLVLGVLILDLVISWLQIVATIFLRFICLSHEIVNNLKNLVLSYV